MARSLGTSVCVLLAGCVVLLSLASRAAEQSPWLEIHSTHFTVITDAGDKKGKEVALRFEQMRAVFAVLLMKEHLHEPLPLTIIAFKNDKDYYQAAPLRQGQPIAVPGFFLPGEDQNFIVLIWPRRNPGAPSPTTSPTCSSTTTILKSRHGSTKAWPNTSVPSASTTRSTKSVATLSCTPPQAAMHRSRSPNFSADKMAASPGSRFPTCSPRSRTIQTTPKARTTRSSTRNPG